MLICITKLIIDQKLCEDGFATSRVGRDPQEIMMAALLPFSKLTMVEQPLTCARDSL